MNIARTRVLLGIFGSIAIFFLMSTMQYRRAEEAIQNTAAVIHTQEILRTLDDVVLALIDAQRGVRGFVITGNESFLEPYELAAPLIDDRMEKALALTSGYPAQQSSLREMTPNIEATLKIYRDTIDQRRAKGFSAASAIVLSGKGKKHMDTMRAQITQIGLEQNQLLKQKLAANKLSQEKSLRTIFWGNVIALLMLLTTLGFSYYNVIMQQQAQKLVAVKNQELEVAYRELDQTRKDQLRTKDQLLSHVSHELRTPLTAAYQFVENLRDGLGGKLNANQQEFTDIAHRNLKQLRNMIGDLLEATRMESAKIVIAQERMSLAAASEEVMRNLYSPAAERQIVIKNELEEIPDVYADPARVRQVVTNLLHNAVKFTPEKGTITVKASCTPEQDAVLFSITNTGEGISAEALAKLFSRLYQVNQSDMTTRQGLGLGLYICKELITTQGGKIWAESEAGKSATFYFTLPRYTEHGEHADLKKGLSNEPKENSPD